MQIGERFKNLRKSMGLNQTDFGEIFGGLAFQTISDIERGIKKPSKTTIELAKFRFGEKFGLNRALIPPENSSARSGSTNDTKGIPIHGYEFRDRKKILKWLELLCHLERLDSGLYNRELKCMKRVVEAADYMEKKAAGQG